MEKFSRNQRIAAITKILVEKPNKVINLNNFTEIFNAAKSTISEDIVIIRDILNKLKIGNIETISGASGGIKYACNVSEVEKEKFANELCFILKEKNRIIPGNFIYMTDVMYNPEMVHKAAAILSLNFNKLSIDYVVTVETKGIPLAYEVAKLLGVQLIIVRRDSKVTEGPTVSINYLSGSSKRIQNMSLSKRSMKRGSKCVFIDDFMKVGGTALGIIDLLREFDSEVLGIGVLIDSVENKRKLVNDYISILKFNGISEDGTAVLIPSENKK
ncbi:pur operon repressor [Clostridium pasteurianum]|uniref:Pur operon repressor n=1 Tax=Clostridium pasteurianum BC1 TaxID=86416 RepID=R4K9P4_CLOPA|nr:pur operon repressor [Clostridium pasteurianum]AGK99288.1 pur operon repressor [Clostridium pasteurianum BC1]